MLANQFADFFMETIRTIRDSLEGHQIYNPQETAKVSMCKFEQVKESEVARCIRNMASKSCELDAIPTTILEQVLDTTVVPITRIVICHLKVAFVHPNGRLLLFILSLRNRFGSYII